MRRWLEMEKEELSDWLAGNGQPAYRAEQLFNWLHRRRAADFSEMGNLPRELRSRLAASGRLRVLEERGRRFAADGLTAKLLLAAPGGVLLESVLIAEKRLTRRTACLSCMSGCPLGCRFCATGGMGFSRNLSSGEIMEQVYRLDRLAGEFPGRRGVSHVVFMGMGEPLLNLDAVLAAADRLSDPGGLGVSGRRVTISTVGVTEGVDRLSESGRNYRLALSLHAPEQRLRERLIPAAKRWPLAGLLAALDRFSALSSRVVTYEYCLIDGVNASPAHAEGLTRLLAGRKGKVNLIPVNPAPGSGFLPPPPERVRSFRSALESAGLRATVRTEKGAEIGAACGQLATAGGD